MCCKSFADELASLAPNVVVEAEKDKVADRVLEELGFAPESVSDDGLVISKPTPQVAHALVSRFKMVVIIVVPSALSGRHAVREIP